MPRNAKPTDDSGRCSAGLSPYRKEDIMPPGSPLRVKAILTYLLLERQEKTSWRKYGELHTMEAVDTEGFRGKIVDAPSRPACRSQMDIEIDGNWRKLLSDQVGFHVQVVYGDYLREVEYALKKLGTIQWQNLSETAHP
jgi:hypothetical protein